MKLSKEEKAKYIAMADEDKEKRDEAISICMTLLR